MSLQPLLVATPMSSHHRSIVRSDVPGEFSIEIDPRRQHERKSVLHPPASAQTNPSSEGVLNLDFGRITFSSITRKRTHVL